MTTNNQHTPGPWRTATDSFGTFVETTGASIAKIGSPDDEINQANARLIAAAPELLEALIEVAGNIRHRLLCASRGGYGYCDCGAESAEAKARSIIAKATIPSA